MPKEMIYSPWSEGSEGKPIMSREKIEKMAENLVKLREKKRLG